MMDKWSKEKRSLVMSRIKSKDTQPELIVRSLLHKLGFRFRLHRKDLPGKPDIVLPKYNLAIFVHGCFWHQHKNCIDGRMPKSKKEYWVSKLRKNIVRGEQAIQELKKGGWQVAVIWECDIQRDSLKAVSNVLKKFNL